MFQKSNPGNIRNIFSRLDALHRHRSDSSAPTRPILRKLAPVSVTTMNTRKAAMLGNGMRNVWQMIVVATAATTRRAVARPRPGNGLSSSQMKLKKSAISENKSVGLLAALAWSGSSRMLLVGFIAHHSDNRRGADPQAVVSGGDIQTNAYWKSLGQSHPV
jgi:hypothetical protein